MEVPAQTTCLLAFTGVKGISHDVIAFVQKKESAKSGSWRTRKFDPEGISPRQTSALLRQFQLSQMLAKKVQADSPSMNTMYRVRLTHPVSRMYGFSDLQCRRDADCVGL
jgi:hypothetical protein